MVVVEGAAVRSSCRVAGELFAGRAVPAAGGAMHVELIQRAADVIFDVPDLAHEEIVMLIDAVAQDTETQAPELAAAFGEWCWLVYTVQGDLIEVLDVGCAR